LIDWSFDCLIELFVLSNARVAQDIFWSLYKNGFVSTESVEQLFCERCQR